MKKLIRRVFGYSHSNRESADLTRTAELESLEPRTLFSAAPVEGPDQGDAEPDAREPVADEAVVVSPQAAQSAAAAVESVELTQEGLIADQTGLGQSGPTEIDSNQGVTLVAIDDETAALNQETLEAIADAAAERWRATGLTAEQSAALESISYEISDLGGNYLGRTEGSAIAIDDDAAGSGAWFIDPTPGADEEFIQLGADNSLSAVTGTSASGSYDLLTALMHEQGHVLGLSDAQEGLMDEVLRAGERRILSEGIADGADPLSEDGARYLSAGLNVSPAELSGMQLLYASDAFTNFDNADNYTTDNSGSIATGSFDRVAYYLELDDGTNDYWVWVSMDTFQTDPALVGVPADGSNIVENGTQVFNLNIESNHPNVTTGTGIDGIVEFWASNYSGGGGGLFNSSDSQFDWKDSGGTTTGGHGSMQVANITPGSEEMVFSITGGGIGIGSQPTGNPDWTFGPNTYNVRNLEIWVGNANELPVVTSSSGNLTYTPSSGPQVIDSALTVADANDANLSGAVVEIVAGALAEDVLAAGALPAGITVDGSSTAHRLVLTGAVSVADYQTALRAVTYENTNGTPDTSSRQIRFTATDPVGAAGSADRFATFVNPVSSSTYVWDNDLGDANWSDATNWDQNSGVPDTGAEIAVFRTVGGTVDLGGATITVDELRFEHSGTLTITNGTLNAGTIKTTGGGTTTIDAVLNVSTDQTISAGSLELTNTANTISGIWTIDGGGALGVASGAAGTADFVLNGGQLNLRPAAAGTADLADVTSGLVLWADATDLNANSVDDRSETLYADGATISGWLNKAGAVTDVTLNADFDLDGVQSDPAYLLSGLNGLPVIDFDGNDSVFMNDELRDQLNGDYTIMTVARYTDSANNDGRLISDRTNHNWLFGYWSNRTNQWYANGWVHLGGGDDSNWHQHTGTMDGSVADPQGMFYNNGVLQTDPGSSNGNITGRNGNNNQANYEPRQLQLGGWQTGSEFSRGQVAEVIIFDRVLSDTERLLVEGYLNEKWEGATPVAAGDFSANDVTVIDDSTLHVGNGLVGAEFGSLTIAADDSLSVSADETGAAVSFADTTLGGGTATLNANNSTKINLNAVTQSAATDISLGGDGIVTLPVANSYTGTTTLNGTVSLRVQDTDSLGGGDVTVNSGGALVLEANNVAENVILNGSGNGAYSAALVDNSGSTIDFLGTINVASSARIQSQAGGEFDLNGAVTIQSGADLEFEIDNRMDLDTTITGDATTSITITGGGDRLDVHQSQPNFSGAVRIESQGRLDVHASNGLGSGDVFVTGSDAGVILRGNNIWVNNFNIQGDGRGTEGAIRFEGSTQSVTGVVTLTGNASIYVNNSTATLTQGLAGGFTLTKTGANTTSRLILQQDSVNLAGFNLNHGQVRLLTARGLGNSTAIDIDSGEAVEFDFGAIGPVTYSNSPTNLNTFNVENGTIEVVSGEVTLDPNFTINQAAFGDAIVGGEGVLNVGTSFGNGNTAITNALDHYGFHINNDNLALNLDGNGGMMGGGDPTTFNNFFGASLLTDGPGNRGLDFNNDTDFINTGSIGTANNYSNLWVGYFTPDASGTWTFRNAGDDDRAGIWFDIDRSGVFDSSVAGLGSNRGEQLSWENTGAKTVTLTAGQSYLVAFTHREGGGGSRADFRVNYTGGGTSTITGEEIVKPTDLDQAGMWSPYLLSTPQNNVTKFGSGTTTLAAANTYNGETTVEAGTLVVSSNDALGLDAGGTTVAPGASLLFDGGIAYTTAEAVTVAGNSGGGNVGNLSGSNSFDGTIAIGNAGTAFLNSIAGDLTINGVISGTGAGSSIAKNGAGVVTLSGDNTFEGVLAINGGSLIAASNTALGSTAAGTTVAEGAFLGLSGGITIAGEAISLNGNGAGSGALLNISGNNAISATSSLVAEVVSLGQIGIGSLADTLTIDADIDLQLSKLNSFGDGDIVINGVISGSNTQIVDPTQRDVILGNAIGGEPGFNALAYWEFNDGTAVDSTGNGNAGVVGSGVVFSNDTGTGNGQAIEFNAEGSNDRITVASAGLETIDDQLTIGFWIKADHSANPNWFRVMRKGNESSAETSWIINRESNTSDLMIRYDTAATGGTHNQNRNTNDVSGELDGTWHHVVFVADNGTSKEYVDGTLVSTQNFNQGTTLGNTFDLVLGNISGNWSGLLDEVFILDTTVTDSQVSALWDARDGQGVLVADNSLVKQGSGTLTLNAANTYEGATSVEAGTLNVDGEIGNGTGADTVTIASGATLSGGGTVNADVATNSGSLNPGGTGATGALIVNGDLDFGAGSAGAFPVEFDASTGDSVAVAGAVNLTNVDLNVATLAGYAPTDGSQLTLIDSQGAGAITGVFNGLADGAEITALASGDVKAYLSYFGGDGNDVTISFIDTVNPGTVTVDDTGADGDTTFELRIVGDTLQVLQNGAVADSWPVSAVRALEINGDDSTPGGEGDDVLTIDYSLDPRLANIDITFNGLGQATATGDRLVVSGGAFGVVTHNLVNGTDGNIHFDGDGVADITYTGLEPVDMTGSTATDFVFNLPAGADNAQLSDQGAFLRLESTDGSPTFEQTDFIAPTGSITINGGLGDTLTVSTALTIASDLTIDVPSISLTGNISTTAGTAGGDQTYDGVVTLGASIDLTADDVFLNNAVSLGANNLAVNVSGTFSSSGGGISGTGQLIKQGAGTLTLSGNNSFAGEAAIEAGTLIVESNTALGSTAGSTTVADGAVLAIQGGVTIGDDITAIGLGTGDGVILNVSGDNTLTGQITLANVLGTTIDPSADFSGTVNPNGVWSYGFTPTLGGAFTAFDDPATSSGVSEWFHTSTGPAPSIRHNPTGSTVTLFGTVQFDPGEINIHPGASSEVGVLRFTAPTAGTYLVDGRFFSNDPTGATTDVHLLVNGVSAFDGTVNGVGGQSTFVEQVTLGIGDTLDFAVGDLTGAHSFDSTGFVLNQFAILSSDTATIGSTTGTLEIDGAVDAQLPEVTFAGAGNIQVDGAIGESGGATANVTKTGSGTTTMASAGNSYTGETTVGGGTLRAGAVDVWDDTDIVHVDGGAILDLNDFDQTVEAFDGAGTVDLGTGILTTGGDNTSTTFSGNITGAGGLTKNGTGDLTLSGGSDYDGVTNVNLGKVIVQHENALGSTAGNTETAGNGASAGGQVLIDADNLTIAEAIILRGGNNDGIWGGPLRNQGSNNEWSGAITLGNDSRISQTGAGNSLRVTGGVTGSAGFIVNNSSAGDVTFESNPINIGGGGFETHAGVTVINVAGNTWGNTLIRWDGTLRTDMTNVLPANTVVILGNADAPGFSGVLDLNGNDQTVAGITDLGPANREITSGTAATLTVNETTTRTYAGTITGAVGLVKEGAGSLTLSGDSTYSGVTTIDNGILRIAHANALGATGAASHTIIGGGNGDKLEIFGGITTGEHITNAGGGGGKITGVSGGGTFTGPITLQAGMDVRGNDLTFKGGITSLANEGLSFNGSRYVVDTNAIDLNGGTLTITSAGNNPANTAQLNVGGNDWGLMRINFGGYLTLGAANVLPSDANVEFGWHVQGSSSGTLDLDGFDQTVASIGVTPFFADKAGDQNITGGGTLTVNQTANTEYQGRITDGATATNLVKDGTGTLTLNNLSGTATSYTGDTTVNGGTLVLIGSNSATGAIGSSTNIVVNNGGTITTGTSIHAGGASTADNGMFGSNSSAGKTITINSGGLITNTNGTTQHLSHLFLDGGTLNATTANPTWGNWNIDHGVSTSGTGTTSTISGGNVKLTQSGGTNFDIAATDTLTVSSAIDDVTSGGETNLVKTGGGTMVLTGTNTYANLTSVSAGTLLINGDSSAAAGAISVASGAIFGGTGASGGAVTMAAGSFLSPGISVADTEDIATSNLVLNANATYQVQLDGATTVNAASVGAGGALAGSIIFDTAGARLNIDTANGSTLQAGTYAVPSISFNAQNGGAGVIRPFLVRDLGGGSYETIWVGDAIDAAGGQETVSYAGETFNLTSTETIYSGVYHDGVDRIGLVNGVGTTQHDGSPTEPTAVGQTVTGISNPNLGRTYAFGVEVEQVSNHDQIDVTGTVDVTGSMLDLSLGYSPSAGDVHVIIDNDGTDAVIGTFSGLAEGASPVDGEAFTISYVGGDGNDVVLFAGTAETDVAIDGSGNLVISDITNDSADDVTVEIVNVGGTNYYQISDSDTTRVFSTTNIGSGDVLRPNASTVQVKVSAVTGGLIVSATSGTPTFDVENFTIASNLNLSGDALVNAGTTDLEASVTVSGVQTYNTDVNQGALDVTLTADTITFNGTTTLHPTGSSNTFALNASSGGAENTAGNLFDMNGGRLRLISGTELVNNGDFETGENAAAPIFADSNTGNKITNNGTFTHNGSQLRLYVEITNTATGIFNFSNPSGTGELEFKVPSGNGPGGLIRNQGTMNLDGGTNLHEAGHAAGGVINESGGILNFNTGTVTVAESAKVTNESGGVLNIDTDVTIDAGTTFTNDAGGDINLVGGAFTVTLNGATAALTNDGTVTWGAGNDGNKGIGGSGTFVNNGTFDHAYGGGNDNLVLSGSLTFQNNGTFDLQERGDVQFGDGSTASFVNAGNLVNTVAGSDPSFFFSFDKASGTFTQTATGTVEAQAGRLRIASQNNSSDTTGTWTANGGDIEFAEIWTGTVTGIATGSGDFRITNSDNGAVESNFAAGTGGITFDVSGNGLTWDEQTISTSAGNFTNADTMTIAGTTGVAKVLAGGGELITGNGATTTVTGTVSATGGSLFRVAGAGTMDGTGTVNGPVTVDPGGFVAPGLSPGVLSTGDLDLDGTFEVEIDGNAGAGTAGGHDQLAVTGSVDLTGSTLNLGLGFTPGASDSFTIIDNDTGGPGDAVIGEFSGLAEGSTFFATSGDTTTPLTITYAGGDGNDVVISYDSTPEITGTPGVDHFLIREDGSGNIEVHLTAGPGFGSTIGSTIIVTPRADLTNLVIDGLAGNDTFTVDYGSGGGFFDLPIIFNGNDPTLPTMPGDALFIDRGAFTTVTHDMTGSDSGNFDIDGNIDLISYTGLEPVDMTGSTATDLILNLPAGADNARLRDIDGVPGGNLRLLSTDGVPTFESTDFAPPTGSVTINGGSDDSLDIFNGITMSADLIVSLGTVNVNGAVDVSGATTPLIGIETNNLAIAATLNAGTGRAEIDPFTAGTNIHLGNTTPAGELNLTDTEIDLITAGVLQIGDATSGRIQFSGTTNGGLISPANASTVHLITGSFVTDGANNNTGGGIRVANLAIEAGGANAGDDRAIRINNTNNGVESRVETFAASSSDGWIEFREDNNTGTPTPGLGLMIGTVDGVSGVINTSNTGDNNRERITINVQQGDVVIANDMSSRRNLFVRALGNQNQIVLNSGVTIGHVEGGPLTLRADNIDLEGNINSPGRTVELMQDDNDNAIEVGTGAVDVLNDDILEIDQAELNRITAGSVYIGRHDYGSTDGSGDITVVGTTTLANATQLRFRTNTTVTQNAGATITENNLGINARGDVSLDEANVIDGNLAIDLQTGSAATSGNIVFRNNDSGVWNINGTAGVGNFLRTDNGDILVTSIGTVNVDESTGNTDVEVEARTMGIGNGDITFNIGAGTTDGRDFQLNDATDTNNDKTDMEADGDINVNLLGTGDSRIFILDSAQVTAGENISFDVLGSNTNTRIVLHGGSTVTSGGTTDFVVRASNGQFITNFDDLLPVTVNSTSGTFTVQTDRFIVNSNSVLNAGGQRMIVRPFANAGQILLGETGDGTDNNVRMSQAEIDTITADVLQLGDNDTYTGNIRITGDTAVNPAQVDTVHLRTGGNVSDDPNDHIEVENLAITVPAGTVTLNDADTDIDVMAVSGGGAISVTDTDDIEIATADGLVGIDSNGGIVMLDARTDVNINATVMSGGGTITVLADNDVNFNASGKLTNEVGGASTITVTADNDVSSAGGITMVDGSSVTGFDGVIDFEAFDDIALSDLDAIAEVRVTTTGGAILDNTASEGRNVCSINIALRAFTGIGDAATDDGDIDMRADNLAATTATGDIHLTDNGFLDITTVDGLAGVSITVGGAGDEIMIREEFFGGTTPFDTFDISQNVTNAGSGNITLSANGDVVGDDYDIAANVTASGGDILIVSYNDVEIGGSSTLSTTGSGTIEVHAGRVFNYGAALTSGSTFGDVVTVSGSQIQTTDGNATVTGADVTISGDVTTLGTGAVDIDAVRSITVNSGAIVSTVNGGIDIDANAGGAVSGDFDAVSVHGSVTSTSGDIRINAQSGTTGNKKAVNVEQTGSISTSAGGTITINATAHGPGFADGVRVEGSISTVDGALDITGTGSANGNGIELGNLSGGVIEATGSGKITLTGTAGGLASDGVAVLGAAGTRLGAAAGTGDIEVISDQVNFSNTVANSGALTIRPLTPGTTIGVGGGTGLLNITDAEILFLQDGFSSITIGDAAAGTGAVDVDSSIFEDDITIVGGTIAVTELDADNTANNDVTLTARTGAITDGGDAGSGDDVTGDNITLNAAGDIGSDTTGDEIALAANTITTDTSGTSSDQYLSEIDAIDIASFDAGTGIVTLQAGGEFDLGTNTVADGSFVEVEDGATLDVNGATDTIAGVTVNDGGTLQGDGTIVGPVTVNDGGTGTPGGSPGIIATGNLTLNSGSTFFVELDGIAGAGLVNGHDQYDVTGSVTLNDGGLVLDTIPGSYTPSAGDSFVIINNDLSDAVTGTPGTFDGLAEGTYISTTTGGGLPDQLLTISYVGGTGNDVVLTMAGETVTTNVSIDGGGNLVIDDILGANTDDNLSVSLIGGSYVIEDLDGNALGTLIVGATQTSVSRIEVPVGLVTGGGIDVNTLGGDDTVTIGDLGTLNANGNLSVDGDTGQDSIIQTGDATLTGTGAVDYDAERIFMQGGSSLTTGSGNVDLNGTGVSGNGVGVRLRGADITSTSGNVGITGQGGTSGVYNRGILLDIDTATATASSISTGGEITLNGTGGSAGVHATGVTLIGGTVESTGAGPVTIAGTGGTGSLFSEGVAIHKGSTVNSGTGDLTINATGGSTGNFNRGITASNSDLVSAGGNIAVNGTGGGTGFYGVGTELNRVDVTTTGAGTITLKGTGASGTLGNMGLKLAGFSDVSSVNGAILIEGTANGSSVLNHGVQLATGSQVRSTGTGAVTVSGSGGAGTVLNHGIEMVSNSSLSVTDGDLTVTGTAQGMLSLNSGVKIAVGSLTATGGGNIQVTGTGSTSASGALNNGIDLTVANITTASGNLSMNGAGGTGSSLNQGIRMIGGSLRSTAGGNLSLIGTANGGTAGVYNTGIYLLGMALDSTGGIDVAGTGGGGTLLNHGVYMQSITTPNTVPVPDGTAGAGNMSEDEAGNFFTP